MYTYYSYIILFYFFAVTPIYIMGEIGIERGILIIKGHTGNFRNSAHPSEHPMSVY